MMLIAGDGVTMVEASIVGAMLIPCSMECGERGSSHAGNKPTQQKERAAERYSLLYHLFSPALAPLVPFTSHLVSS